jgi:hypothetical protein
MMVREVDITVQFPVPLLQGLQPELGGASLQQHAFGRGHPLDHFRESPLKPSLHLLLLRM